MSNGTHARTRADAPPIPRAQTCREYGGRARGYCPRPGEVADRSGSLFCAQHAQERNLT